jgi:hypothetical protein
MTWLRVLLHVPVAEKYQIPRLPYLKYMFPAIGAEARIFQYLRGVIDSLPPTTNYGWVYIIS